MFQTGKYDILKYTRVYIYTALGAFNGTVRRKRRRKLICTHYMYKIFLAFFFYIAYAVYLTRSEFLVFRDSVIFSSNNAGVYTVVIKFRGIYLLAEKKKKNVIFSAHYSCNSSFSSTAIQEFLPLLQLRFYQSNIPSQLYNYSIIAGKYKRISILEELQSNILIGRTVLLYTYIICLVIKFLVETLIIPLNSFLIHLPCALDTMLKQSATSIT